MKCSNMNIYLSHKENIECKLMCGTAQGWNSSLAQQQNCVDASVVFRVVGDLKENPTFAVWATTVQEC